MKPRPVGHRSRSAPWPSTITGVNARDRGQRAGLAQAGELRARAAAIRADLDEQEQALRELREANDAGKLDADAARLERDQGRANQAVELRAQADAVEASTVKLAARAHELNVEMLAAAIRSARFEEQLTGDIARRRQELERRSAQGAEAGDAEAVLAAERDLALLPTLESRLREQADAAASNAAELASEATKAEGRVDELRASAAALRHSAEVEALPAGEPPPAPGEPPARSHLAIGVASSRSDALRALQVVAGFHLLDPVAAAEAFERDVAARRVAAVDAAHTSTLAQLAEIAVLVARVQEVALDELRPSAGAPRRWDAPGSPLTPGRRRMFPGACEELERATERYRARAGCEMPACTRLAAHQGFEYANDVVEAATSATRELDQERVALDAALQTARARLGASPPAP